MHIGDKYDLAGGISMKIKKNKYIDNKVDL
jgi:hypothetical protein